MRMGGEPQVTATQRVYRAGITSTVVGNSSRKSNRTTVQSTTVP